jgi:type IV secretory pathway VirB2 component (pilin)
VLSSVLGRAITGPLAFFVAGVIDVAAFGVQALRARLRRRFG